LRGELFEPTFSNPKNLSLPSFRSGPAFCSIFCKGVISGSGSASFFPDFGEDTPGLVAPYSIAHCQSVYVYPFGALPRDKSRLPTTGVNPFKFAQEHDSNKS
jgi:hypothetical protein